MSLSKLSLSLRKIRSSVLCSDNLYVLVSHAGAALISFLLSYFLAKYVSKSYLGEYLFYFSLAVSLSGIVSGPLGMWLTRSEQKKLEYKITVRRLWNYLSAGVCLAGLSLFSIASNVGISLLLCGFMLLSGFYSYSWNSAGSKKLFSLSVISFPLMRFVFLLLVVLAGYQQFLLVITVSALLIVLLFLEAVNKKTTISVAGFSDIKVRQIIGDFFPLIKYMSVSSSVFMVYQISDKFFVKYILGYDAVAELSILFQWSYTLVVMALHPFVMLAYPSILQEKDDVSKVMMLKYMLGFAIITFLMIIFGELYVGLFSEYIPSGYEVIEKNIWIGMLAGGVYMSAQIMSTWFSKERNEKYYLIVVLLASFFAVPTIYLLIKAFGVVGALWGHMLYSFLYFSLCFWIVFKKDFLIFINSIIDLSIKK